MPKIDKVVRTENGETYRLVERLGDGAIAAVWRGVAEKAGIAEQVAIKITDPAMRQQFDAEYDTLNRLLNAGAGTWPGETKAPLVPAFIHKATLEPEGQAALVTELIRVDTLTKLVLDEGDLVRRQEILVEPAYQYAWFLDFMHKQVSISQSDRKLGDLYWDAEQQRLIVLGWDVVERGTARAPEDVYKFGEMWYALLLGVTPALMLGVTTSHEWGQLSVAWRSVLEACLRPTRQARPTAEGLSAMMAQRQGAYVRTAEELYRAGQQALEQAKEDLGQSERAWWLLDLAWQKGLEDAHRLSQEAENLFRGRGQRLLESARFNLELGMFSTAEAALNKAKFETDNSPGFQLRVARWRCLVDAAKVGLEEGIAVQFRNVVHHLIAAVKALESGQWRKVTKELESARDGLPENSKTHVMLQSLERESDLYQVLIEATVRRGNGEFFEAAEKYQIARDLLSEIVYQNAVELTIVDLAYEKVECERLAETEGKLKDGQVQLPRLVNAGHYGEAKSLYDQVLLLTRGNVEIRQALDAVFEPVRELEALSRASQHPDVPAKELARQAHYLLNRFPGNIAVQREAEQVAMVLLLALEQYAREAKFIQDINDALNLGQTLQSLAESARVKDAVFKRCNQAIATLEHKRTVYHQAIELYRGDLQSKIQAIQIVRQVGVELFRDNQCSVAHIYQILTGHESLQQTYASLQQRYDNLQLKYTSLQQGHENLQQDYASLEQGHENLQQDHVSLEQGHENLQQDHASLQQRHENLQQDYASLEQGHENLQQDYASLEQGHENLQQDYASLQQGYENLQQKHTSLQQKYKRLQQEHKAQRTAWKQSQSVRQETGQVEVIDMSKSTLTKVILALLAVFACVIVVLGIYYQSQLQNQATAAETSIAVQLTAQAATAEVNVAQQLTAQAATAEADTAQQLAAQAATAEADTAIQMTSILRTQEAELRATATFAPMATETAIVRATETAVAQATATAAEATATTIARATATAAYQATATQAAWDMGPGRAISLTSESPQRGQISPVGDADWFKFAISDQSTVVIETSGTQGDTRMWLYDSDLTEIEVNDDSGSERFSQIDRMCGTDSLLAGTYYVKITDYGDDDEIAGYNITLTAIPCR
ncbi:MAG: hypothetical protein GY832_17090 [Chloroflexi bacterium]|nr:hypothetical protein [Chloroflexota bacterium]